MNIITVHPINEDLRFLKKLVRKIHGEFSEQHIGLRLSNNLASHETTLQYLNRADEGELVIFLNHGATRSIHGSEYRAKYGAHPKKFIYHEENGYLIDKDNIEILSGKKVFCLSCNSSSLGRLAINSGVKAFIGFNIVDFDIREELKPEQHPRSYVVARTKFALREAVFKSLKIALKNKMTFGQLFSILKVCLNQEMDQLLLDNKGKSGYQYYKAAADSLLTIREGMELFGNSSERLF